MIRGFFTLCFLAGFVYFGLTVKLGSRTLFGHAVNIWQAEETQEMVDGVKQTSAPVVEKVARGARAGWDEVTNGDAKPAVGTDAPAPGTTAPSHKPPVKTSPGGAGDPASGAPAAKAHSPSPEATTTKPSPAAGKVRPSSGKTGSLPSAPAAVVRSRSGAPS